MDKKRIVNGITGAFSIICNIRYVFRIVVAFAIGILSAFALYPNIYGYFGNKAFSYALSAVGGALITTLMILFLVAVRHLIRKITVRVTELYKYRKGRKADVVQEDKERE